MVNEIKSNDDCQSELLQTKDKNKKCGWEWNDKSIKCHCLNTEKKLRNICTDDQYSHQPWQWWMMMNV